MVFVIRAIYRKCYQVYDARQKAERSYRCEKQNDDAFWDEYE